jgi:hypothetical protein
MIRYTLNCANDHSFESWFPGSDAFDKQVKRGFVTCPQCGSAKVAKAIMAPNVGRRDLDRRDLDRGPGARTTQHVSTLPSGEAPAAEPAGAAQRPVAIVSEKERELRAMLRAVRTFVEANSEDVGRKFASQARKMHDGEIEHRAIRGEASGEDVKALIEDGIEVHPLPVLPDERN